MIAKFAQRHLDLSELHSKTNKAACASPVLTACGTNYWLCCDRCANRAKFR